MRLIHNIVNCPFPSQINAFSTTRHGGVSHAPYHQLNLDMRGNDHDLDVLENRQRLLINAQLPDMPIWLDQSHGSTILRIEKKADLLKTRIADATYSNLRGAVCTVMTADCLPILLCSIHGTEVAAIHAGWRGLASGIIKKTVMHFCSPAINLMAWLGPAIGPQKFIVGAEVKAAFAEDGNIRGAFSPISSGYLANLYLLAMLQLQRAGIKNIYGGEFCTFTDQDYFFSYRRDKGITGRMATMIWLC